MNDVLVIGIATVDAIARTIDEFPKPGGLRFFDQLALSTGGCAINCSLALAKLGVPCDTIARVGTDMLGDFVVAELARHGMATDGIVRDASTSTAFSFACVASSGERCFFHTRGADDRLCPADVPPEWLGGRQLVFVAGTMVMEALDGEPTAQVLAAARAAGARTLLDTVYVEAMPRAQWQRRVLPALPYVDYFVPSHAEATAISGLTDVAAIARDFQACGARNVVIKLGAEGAFCRSAEGVEQHVPAFRVPQVVDTTGAGDCWSAGFLVGLREKLPMAEAARLGNAVAAHGIQASGATAGVKPLGDVRAFMQRGAGS
ncbi:MAG TPA: carbohydrate kinase family protein [Phycisphaerae bacterium]|nr:carbohydrate kinase family protein [Phycisphaerae bacterium]HNU44269.1 carbohydrate kinase family protein [Phycisphaerae bacterium]